LATIVQVFSLPLFQAFGKSRRRIYGDDHSDSGVHDRRPGAAAVGAGET
jgi:hypothetical protein